MTQFATDARTPPSQNWILHAVMTLAMVGSFSPAMAYTFSTSPDWDVELDTNLSYSLGIRTQGINPLIGNNPIQQNDEYKFPKAGDVNSNRIDIASELVAAYQNNYGIDVSVDGWKDFAYDGGVATHPGQYGPGVPYSALSSSPDGRYGAYTYNNYDFGGELENAFAFGNFQFGDIPVTVKIGRFTEYWGNALFSGYQAISYGQSPIDVIKAVDAPGTEVKDLFLPRGQVSIHVQPTPSLTFGFQYAFEFRYNQFPEGGTFLGIADPFVIGPTTIEGQIPRGSDDEPPNVDGNFGLEMLWEPDALNGTVGLYFRQFDDTTPYALYQLDAAGGSPTYHLSYARHIQLFGVSLDHEIGPVGASFEASIRKNTGLNGVPGGDPGKDPGGTDGPRGTTFNFVANGIYALTPNKLWQTGSLVGEIAWTHLMAVTHDASAYNAIGYACAAGGLNAGSGERDGCSTTDEVNVNVVLDPQWLQVLPGVDFDAPMSVGAGLHGNGQTAALAGTGDNAATIAYSIGVHALIRQKYNIKLSYTGYSSPTNGIIYTPLGKPYYAGGSGEYMWNDKESIDLVLSTAF
jgi:hypothetical protein